jgi:hypothetical protein
MNRTDGVEARQGQGLWMRGAHLGASLLAAVAIFIAPTGLWIKLLLLGGLPVVYLATARRMRRSAQYAPRIRLFEDGSASILTRSGAVPALLQGGVWSSRWFSAFRLERLDGRGPVDCIVCRSANPADAYRRLQVILRLGSGPDAAVRRGWQ